MRIYYSILLLSFLMLQNCNKEQVNSIEGIWKETHPVPDRIEIIFQGNNQLVQKTNDNEASVTFTYEILQDSISLSSNEADMDRPIVVFFKIVSSNEFQIGDFTTVNNSDEILQFRKVE